MSSRDDDVDDIVQSFVHTDLASLDRIGDQPDSFTLSPHLTDRSPKPNQSPWSQSGQFASAPSRAAREGPGAAASPPPVDASATEVSDAVPPTAVQASAAPHTSPRAQNQPSGGRPAGEPVARQPSSARNVSVSSTASVSTQEREKRASLGDKFKMFGKRITSGSKK